MASPSRISRSKATIPIRPFARRSRSSVRIALVVAMARNGVIGRDNAMPWRLPDEMAHFVRVTMGKPVVMGRRTWESLKKPLAGRANIVVTHQPGYEADGAIVVHSLAEAWSAAG